MPVSFTLNRLTTFRPLTGDQDGDGYADAGDVLRHTLTIHNTGDTAATSVVLNDLLGGSTETGLMNISPIAFDDAFTAVGNTALRVGGAANIGTGPSSIVAGNLLANDVGSTTVGVGALAADDVTGFTIDTVTNLLTAGGGRYSIFADGSFNYISEAGDTGSDSFSYTIRDAGIDGVAGNSDDTTSTATVTITLTGQVWYVDSAAAGGGTGTSANPFNSITALQAANVDGANDFIYVKGNATGQLVMETGEHLIGQGADLDVAGFHLADDGARSTVTNNAAGFGVTLAGGGTGNNEIAGINIVSTGGAGNHGLTGTSFGNLTINNTTIDASGQALVLSTGAIVAGSTGLVSTDSDGGTNNVSLTGITGSLTLGSGALSGATGAAFNVSGGSVTTAYTGNITQAQNAALVNVAGGHSGSLTFSTGTLSATNGTGLQFDNADGSYNFNGTNTLNGGDAGVDIVNGSSGNFSFSSSSAITNATGIAFNVNGGNGNIDYNGTISHTANTRAISVQNHNGGTVSFDGTVSATGSSDGILLATNTGAVINFTSTLTINASGANFDASGGGTITATGANSVINSGNVTALSVVNTNIGAADLNFQSISSSGSSAGIVLNNTGTTIGTHGGLTVTGTGVTDGSGGTIQNTTGRGASFINAIEIKLSNMTFTNAGTSDLDADNSGLSTGDNLATNAAIHLQTVTNVLLTNVDITGGAEQGINGNTVTNFALVNSSITNVGNGADEDGIHFYNMAGSSRITNTTISGSGDDNLNLQMQSGNLDLHITGGSVSGGVLGSGYLFGIRGTALANLNLDGVNSSNNFSGGVVADAFDNATMNIRVNASTSSNNNDQISISSSQASNVDADITGNTVNSTTPTLDFVGISLLGAAFSTGTFDARVNGNTITIANGVTADGMSIFEAGAGTMNLAVTNNIFTYAGTQRGILIQAGQDGAGTIRGTITGNSMDIQLDGAGNAVNGILAQSGVASPSGDGSFINLDIGGAGALANTFTHSLGGALAGGDIRVRQRFSDNVNLSGYVGGATDTAAVAAYLDSRNNEVSASTASFTSGTFSGTATPAFITVTVSAATVAEDGATNLIYTFTRTGSTAASLVSNFAITGTATAGTDYVVSGATTFTNGTGLGTITFSAGSATTAITVDPSADGVAEADESVVVDAGNSATANGSFARALITNDDAALFLTADHGPDGGKSGGNGTGGELPPPSGDPGPAPGGDQPIVVDDGIISQAELNLIVDAAIDRWAAAGATAEQVAAMRATSFSVEDISGLSLAMSSGNHITIDSNAAGFSWFIDATPGEDGEYSGSGTRLTAAPDSQAGVRIDLLTTIMHELGHQIGLGDDTNAADRDELMYGLINPGERRLPGNDDLAGSGTTPLTGTAFALSPVSLGTIPAGRIVVVQWDSTVNAFTNQVVPTFNNTSSVSGGNFVTATSNNEILSPTSAPIALDTLTLGDKIYIDVNANNVLDGGDTGVAGVTLKLYADANGNGVLDGAELTTVLATTTTLAGGVYSFAGLAPGDYVVSIDASNFTGGGALVGKTLPAGAATDPDDNTDNDNNGIAGPGGTVISNPIRLDFDSEPTADGTGKFDINNTLDFGFLNPNQPPVFTGLDGTPTFTEGAAAVVLDSNATVSDPNLTASNYSGATLTLARSGGASAQDVFGGTGGAGLTLTGPGNVDVNGTTIGTYTQSGGTLAITFNANATQALVNAALEGITYSNGSDNPPASAVIAYVFNDGNTGIQGSGGALAANGSVTVSITPTNDAPTAILSNHNLGPATEQVAFDLKNSGLSVGDIDGNSGSETVTLAVGQGVLNVTAGTSGAGVAGSGTATVTITGTIAQINALLNTDGTSTVSYTNGSDSPPASSSLTLTIHDNGNTGGGDLSASDSGTISIAAVNDAPVFSGLDGTPAFTEGGAAVVLDSNATVTDPDLTASNYNGATLTLARSGGASAQDVFGGTGGAGLTLTGPGNVDINGTTVGTYTQSGGTLTITFNTNATQALVNAALQGITYSNSSGNPPASAVIAYVFDDGNAGAQGSGGALAANGSVTVSITGTDDPAVAVNDPGNATNENATVNIAVLANDSDPDGPPPSVAKVNGTAISVGSPVTLTSGAKVSLNLDGTLTYDPNGQFNTLTSTASGETGAVNTSKGDSFTYTLAGAGGGTATVSITVNGVVSIQDHLEGDSGDNVITGTPNGDYFDLSQGGNDTASGLGANDGFFFGAEFTAADTVDGGAGTNDQIGLQGDYTGGNALVLGANTIANIEAIVVLPGYSYDITTNDGNVAAGGILKVQATPLGVGENLTFNGSAETNGSFLVYGGLGNDTMTGGAGNDGFYFGPGGFNSSDTVNGGGGTNDQLALDGNYGAFGPAFVLGGNVTNVEVIVMLPGPSGSPNTFNLTTTDALVPAGQTMTIFGIQVATNIIFDGSNEHDGAFRIYGGSGNDIFTGGTGNDWIFGGYGGDQLTGGAGSDNFYYDDAAQSTSLGFDTIFGFDDSADTIDLPFAVTGLAAPASGNLSNASFDTDLSAAFAGLTSHEAGMFTATGGDMAGRTFLVIDADGNAGYQAGSDYVMEIITPVTPIDNPAIFV